MPKISLDMPREIVSDLKKHVGDSRNLSVWPTQLEPPVGRCWISWTKLTQDTGGD